MKWWQLVFLLFLIGATFDAHEHAHGQDDSPSVRAVHPVEGLEAAPTVTPGTNLVSVGNVVYFAGEDGVYGTELWRTDGMPAGTFLVKDIAPGAASSNVAVLDAVNGLLLFAPQSSNGRALWVSDGTGAGTMLLRDFAVDTADSVDVRAGFTFDNQAYFAVPSGRIHSSGGPTVVQKVQFR